MRQSAEVLARALAESGIAVCSITVTANRSHLLSVKTSPDGRVLRVAAKLLETGPDVIPDIVAWVLDRPGAKERMQARINQLPADDAYPGRPRRVVIRTRGQFHDLAEISAAERKRFGDPPEVQVTWGARTRRRRRQRSIRFGSYDADLKLIRVHSLLDHQRVPSWFIGFVIYHELLHHQLGVESSRQTGNTRRRIHTRRFHELEALHPRFANAKEWEKRYLNDLLRGRL